MINRTVEAAICDANILIDYINIDEDIIREMVLYWKKVNVPDIVLHEVNELSLERARELGLTVIETPLELPASSGLSFQDRACLHFVQSENWICLSNDKALRRACTNAGGQVIWGLQMLLIMVENEKISKARAADIALKIHIINPEITDRILDNFNKKLNSNNKKRNINDNQRN